MRERRKSLSCNRDAAGELVYYRTLTRGGEAEDAAKNLILARSGQIYFIGSKLASTISKQPSLLLYFNTVIAHPIPSL